MDRDGGADADTNPTSDTVDASAQVPTGLDATGVGPVGPPDDPALYGFPSGCSVGGEGGTLEDGGPLGDGGTTSCYAPASREALQGKAPVQFPKLCSREEILGLSSACIEGSGNCAEMMATNLPCANCLFGNRDNVANRPVPALLQVGVEGTFLPNVGACAALVAGKPECALPLAKQLVCQATVCSACTTGTSRISCERAAGCGECGLSGNYSPACTSVIESNDQWNQVCRGSDGTDTFVKVATVLCGSR